MGVQGLSLTKNYLCVAKKYSVAIDGSLFYQKTDMFNQMVDKKLSRTKILSCLISGATELFICWDGFKPLQKNQTLQSRNHSCTIDIPTRISIVLNRMIGKDGVFLNTKLKRIFVDSNQDGEGEWKCLHFSGWKRKVDAIYIVVNDNDSFYGLYKQPRYSDFFFKKSLEFRTKTNSQIEVVEIKNGGVYNTNYNYNSKIPQFKFHEFKGVIDFWNDSLLEIKDSQIDDRKLSLLNNYYINFKNNGDEFIKFINYIYDSNELREIYFEMCMYAFIIAFGNDYVPKIIPCRPERQKDIMLFCAKYLYENLKDIVLIQQSNLDCNFDLFNFTKLIVRFIFGFRFIKKKEYEHDISFNYYYYRLFWNFFYSKFSIVNINDKHNFNIYYKEGDYIKRAVLKFHPFSTECIVVEPQTKIVEFKYFDQFIDCIKHNSFELLSLKNVDQ